MLPFSQITGSNTFTTGLGAVSLKGATTVDASFLGFHDVWGRGHWSETWGQGKQTVIVYSIWYHSSNLTWPVGHHVEMGPFTSQSRCLCATLSKSCTMICVAAIHKISTDRVPPKEFDSVRSSRGILGPFVAHFISSVAIWHLTFQVFWKQCSSWNLRLWTHVLKSRACFHSCPKQVHIMLFMMLFEKVHAYIYIYIANHDGYEEIYKNIERWTFKFQRWRPQLLSPTSLGENLGGYAGWLFQLYETTDGDCSQLNDSTVEQWNEWNQWNAWKVWKHYMRY